MLGGGYGPSPKLDAQQSSLLAALAELNENRLSADFGPAPRDIDADVVAAIKQIQAIGFGMRTSDGLVRPFLIPTRVAWEIVMALRGERVRAPEAEGTPVPGTVS